MEGRRKLKFGELSLQQMWSRGHKARGQGQGHKKIQNQGQGRLPRTDPLEAKDRNAGNQRQTTQMQVISIKRSLKFLFRRPPKKKRSSRNKSHLCSLYYKVVLSSCSLHWNNQFSNSPPTSPVFTHKILLKNLPWKMLIEQIIELQLRGP